MKRLSLLHDDAPQQLDYVVLPFGLGRFAVSTWGGRHVAFAIGFGAAWFAIRMDAGDICPSVWMIDVAGSLAVVPNFDWTTPLPEEA